MFKFLLQIVLEILLSIVLFFNVFVSKNMNNTIVLIGLLVFLILNIIINRYQRAKFRSAGDTTFIIFSFCLILMILFYSMGLIYGYSENYSAIYKSHIQAWLWISTFIIVGVSEFVRYVVSQIKFRKKYMFYINAFFLVVMFSLVDMSITTKVYDLTNFSQFYEFFALVFVQSIAKNIFLLYISKNNGYKPCLVYRAIMDLNVYFIPVIAKLNMLLESVVLLIFPYILYVVIQGLDIRQKMEPARKKNRFDGIITFISAVVFGILVILVSREFKYCMIGVGSGSMTGTINKGDAIIYQKYDEKNDELDVGDIIVFRKNNVLIVHRIINRIQTGESYVYRTQGDANESPDNWIVKNEDVVGMVKTRVILIAWPSVLLNELF